MSDDVPLFTLGSCEHCATTRESMAAFARTVQHQASELERLRARIRDLERAQVSA